MANEVDLDIGTLDLDSTNEIAISAIDFKVARQLSVKNLPKAHGAVIPLGYRSQLVARIKGTIKGADYDTLRTNLDSLISEIESRTDEYKLTLDDDRFIKVQYKSYSQGWKHFRRLATFSFDLYASDPFWYSETLNSDSAIRSNGVGFTITNNGNARTRAKITFTVGGTPVADDIKLENETTSQIFEFTGSVAAADVAIVNNRVDTRDLVVTNDGVDAIANFEGDFIELEPGANTLKFYSAVSGITTKVEHRDAWF